MMKRNRNDSSQLEHQNIDTLIGIHSKFHGELAFEGAVRIDGTFEGNIKSSKDGTLIISGGAHVTGEIDVPNLVLHGEITGNVRAGCMLKVGPSGCLHGDVEYRMLSLSEGATINGRCTRIPEQEVTPIQKHQHNTPKAANT